MGKYIMYEMEVENLRAAVENDDINCVMTMAENIVTTDANLPNIAAIEVNLLDMVDALGDFPGYECTRQEAENVLEIYGTQKAADEIHWAMLRAAKKTLKDIVAECESHSFI